MKLILFVCRGNTCRSPMAEAVARNAAARAGLTTRIAFASAGVSPSKIGGPADPRAAHCAGCAGLDLADHKTRAADAATLATADLILALDPTIYDQLAAIAPDLQSRIKPLMVYAPHLGVAEVADPWSGGAADYDHAFALITAATDGLVASLRTG